MSNSVRLQNLIGKTSLVGQIVKLAPNSTRAYVLADTPDPDAIGTVAESVPNKYWGLIDLINSGGVATSIAWDDVTGKPPIPDQLSDLSEDSTHRTVTDAQISGWDSSSAPGIGEEFETISKNLKNYPYALTYGVDGVATITYDLGGGDSIVKTFNYTLGVLTSIVLSGDTPAGIELTKTLSYTGADLTSVAYS